MIYLYMTKRDRTDSVLLTVFEGTLPAMQLSSIDVLKLPHSWKLALEAVMLPYKNFELWAESAGSVSELHQRLRARGFRHSPLLSQPEVWLSAIPTGSEKNMEGLKRQGGYPVILHPVVIKKLQLSQHPSRRASNQQ